MSIPSADGIGWEYSKSTRMVIARQWKWLLQLSRVLFLVAWLRTSVFEEPLVGNYRYGVTTGQQESMICYMDFLERAHSSTVLAAAVADRGRMVGNGQFKAALRRGYGTLATQCGWCVLLVVQVPRSLSGESTSTA